MASYSTNLKDWGASGTEFPDGYSYIEGEQPVDAWDNFITSNLISDVKDHLIPLTNSRVESDYGGAGGEPGSPEHPHVYYDTDNERARHWDATAGSWYTHLRRDGDTMDGVLDMGGYKIHDATGTLTLGGAVQTGSKLTVSGRLDATGQVVVGSSHSPGTDDYIDIHDPNASNPGIRVRDPTASTYGWRWYFHNSNSEMRLSTISDGIEYVSLAFMRDSGKVQLRSDFLDDTGSTLYDTTNNYIPQGQLQNDSIEVTTSGAATGGGTVALGGSVDIGVSDQWVDESGDSMSGNLDMQQNDLQWVGTLYVDDPATDILVGNAGDAANAPNGTTTSGLWLRSGSNRQIIADINGNNPDDAFRIRYDSAQGGGSADTDAFVAAADGSVSVPNGPLTNQGKKVTSAEEAVAYDFILN